MDFLERSLRRNDAFWEEWWGVVGLNAYCPAASNHQDLGGYHSRGRRVPIGPAGEYRSVDVKRWLRGVARQACHCREYVAFTVSCMAVSATECACVCVCTGGWRTCLGMAVCTGGAQRSSKTSAGGQCGRQTSSSFPMSGILSHRCSTTASAIPLRFSNCSEKYTHGRPAR